MFGEAVEEDRTVGRPEVQAFTGRIGGEDAHPEGPMMIPASSFQGRRGVTFPHERKMASSADQGQLAQLMIEHDVGVTMARSYVVEKLDQDCYRSADAFSG